MIAGLALALALSLSLAVGPSPAPPPPSAGAPVESSASPPATSAAEASPPAASSPPPSAPEPQPSVEAPRVAPQEPQPDAPEPEAEQETFAHGGWRHGIALGPHSTTFFSKEGSQYTFHSGSVGYLLSLGERGAFVNLFLLMPLQARQDGHIYATANYYSRRTGADLLFGPEWRRAFRGAEAEFGPGIHGTLIYLPGKPGFRDFSAFPLGAGLGASLRWKTRASRLSRAVMVGTYASAAYDFYDPLHENDLAHGFTFRVGAILGLGERR